MTGDWQETTLGDVTEFLSGGTPPKERPDYWGGSIPWVSAKDMKRLRLEDTEDHVTERGAAAGTKIVPPGTVLLLTRGMTLLNDVPICVAGRSVAFNQDVKALRPSPHVCNEFLPYLLLGNKERLLSLVDLSGHGTGRLNTDELKALDVQLPPEPEQRAIAHILGTLDDSIELSRRMNETLEALATTLFESWFVDFDPVRAKAEGRDPSLPKPVADHFPDSFESSEPGAVPKGWGCGPILSDAKLLSGGTPRTDRLEYWDGEVLWASAKDVSQCGETFLVETERTITTKGLAESATQLVPVFSTIVVARGATTGRLVLSGSSMAMNQTCYALQTTSKTPFTLYCLLRHEIGALVHAAHGSVFDTITTNTFINSRVTHPPARVRDLFESLVAPLFARLLSNTKECRTLRALRDALLPKLISGSLRIKDAESIASRMGA